MLVVDARLAGMLKGRTAKINDPVLGIRADEGKAFDAVPGGKFQRIAAIKIRGELLGVSATDIWLVKKGVSMSKSKRVKDGGSRKSVLV